MEFRGVQWGIQGPRGYSKAHGHRAKSSRVIVGLLLMKLLSKRQKGFSLRLQAKQGMWWRKKGLTTWLYHVQRRHKKRKYKTWAGC